VQTAYPHGIRLLGELVTLDPGESKTFRYEVRDVVEVKKDEKRREGKHLPLKPGSYEILARYEKKDDTVEYTTEKIFARERRIVDGLWTGDVKAAPLRFTVSPASGVFCEIDAPDNFLPGKKAILKLEIRNDTDRELSRDCRPKVRIYSKACGGGEAIFGLRTDRSDAPEGGASPLVLPPWGKARFEIDLTTLNFSALHGPLKGKSAVGFFELFGPGALHVAVELDFTGGNAPAPLKSNDLWACVADRQLPAIPGLSLTLSTGKETVAPGEKTELTVDLINESKADKNLCHRLDFPSRLFLVIEDADGKKKTLFSVTGSAPSELGGLFDVPWEGSARIVRGLSWNRDAFEARKPLTRSDFILIEPVAGVQRSFDLNELLHGGLKPGRYKIHAAYRNLENGLRLGLPIPAEVGLLKSNSITLEVRAEKAMEGSRRSMKGWEIYSWKTAGGNWNFSLLHGTNILKTYDAVTSGANTLEGVPALLEALKTLQKGQEVLWYHELVEVVEGKPAFSYPPRKTVEEIFTLCKNQGLKFDEGLLRILDEKEAQRKTGLSMKGWELYSWKNSGDGKWSFSLLPGTNRIKSYEEVTGEHSALYGLSPLIEALGGLPEGEWVAWVTGRIAVPEGKPGFSRPPPDIVEKIASFCEKRALKFRK
jgi:hypothetical protein